MDCPLRVRGEGVFFRYLGILFTSEGRMAREIDRRIEATSAVMRTLNRSVVVTRDEIYISYMKYNMYGVIQAWLINLH